MDKNKKNKKRQKMHSFKMDSLEEEGGRGREKGDSLGRRKREKERGGMIELLQALIFLGMYSHISKIFVPSYFQIFMSQVDERRKDHKWSRRSVNQSRVRLLMF